MQGGLFITLYDEDSLKLYLNSGLYGFLMSPIRNNQSPTKTHYAILADYACSREGTEVFFFLNRTIIYGGTIFGNIDKGSFFINGKNSPLGNQFNADLFWDESSRYSSTNSPGIFGVNTDNGIKEKSQPFILQFRKNEMTGKYITSDVLYFELGKYPFPLPSNSLQKSGFCTITPGEVNTLMSLIARSTNKKDFNIIPSVRKNGNETLFSDNYIDIRNNFRYESELEYSIVSSLNCLSNLFTGNYIICRQVPISPIKPENMDRADICLYDINDPINDGTIPNIIIELKEVETANFHAYDQVARYLMWLEKITNNKEFNKINAYIIAKKYSKIRRDKIITDKYDNRIKMYCISDNTFKSLV